MYNTGSIEPSFVPMEMICLLKGMRDVSPSRWARLHSVKESLRRHLGLYGYQPVDLPLVEETELFLRKSGGGLAARMYTFTDPGGWRVSLRPEFTASVVRAYMEGSLNGEIPLRLQYAGPVFRYASEDDGGHRQFTQVGAELLGATGAAADAEAMALACSGLARLGLTGHILTVGHLGAINGLLEQMHLSERARVFLLGSISLFRQGGQASAAVREQAQELGLLHPAQQDDGLTGVVRRLGREEVQGLVEGFLKGPVAGPTGQRTPEEIVDRYLRRLQGLDDPRRLEGALGFVERMAAIAGPPAEALKEAQEAVAAFHLDPAPFSKLQETLGRLQAYDMGSAQLRLDFGLARGIAYYTGVVFEMTHPALEAGLSLGGGGRYDDLVTALGGKVDVPALGFAYTLEHVLAVQEHLGKATPNAQEGPPVLVHPSDGASLDAASREAEGLRRMGTPVELDLMGRTVDEARAYAARRGLASVRVVRQDGVITDYPAGT